MFHRPRRWATPAPCAWSRLRPSRTVTERTCSCPVLPLYSAGAHRSSAPGSTSAAFAAEQARGAYVTGPAQPAPSTSYQPLSLYTGPCLAPASLSHGGNRPRLQVPADPAAQLAVLGQLLDTARAVVSGGGSREQQAAALEALGDAAECCSREAWVRTFPLVSFTVARRSAATCIVVCSLHIHVCYVTCHPRCCCVLIPPAPPRYARTPTSPHPTK